MNTSEKNMSDKPANPANAKNAKGLENGKKPTNPENFRDMDGLNSATILKTFDAATILATYPLEHEPARRRDHP